MNSYFRTRIAATNHPSACSPLRSDARSELGRLAGCTREPMCCMRRCGFHMVRALHMLGCWARQSSHRGANTRSVPFLERKLRRANGDSTKMADGGKTVQAKRLVERLQRSEHVVYSKPSTELQRINVCGNRRSVSGKNVCEHQPQISTLSRDLLWLNSSGKWLNCGRGLAPLSPTATMETVVVCSAELDNVQPVIVWCRAISSLHSPDSVKV